MRESLKRIVVATPLSCRPAVALSITVGASRVVLLDPTVDRDVMARVRDDG
jgi:hypothetical protein